MREIFGIREKKLNFVKRIKDYQRELEGVVLKKLKIDFEEKMLDGENCGKVKLSEREFILYSMLAERRKQCHCEEGCSSCFLDITSLMDEIPKHYERFSRYFSHIEFDDKSTVYEVISRIKDKIDGSNFFRKDLIKVKTIGRRKNYKYGIGLSKNKIQLIK